MKPCEMSTFVVDSHFTGFEVVKFLPNGGFVFWRETSPGLVSAAIILVAGGHLDVVVELDDLFIL